MNISKVKSVLESAVFDLRTKSSLDSEAMAAKIIEEKSLSNTMGNEIKVDRSIRRQAMNISNALLGIEKGSGAEPSSICYGFAAMGAILNSPNPEHTGERISSMIAKSIAFQKDKFDSLTMIGKIEFVDATYYRFIPQIKSLSNSKDKNLGFLVKDATLRSLEVKLNDLGINSRFIQHSLSENERDMQVISEISANLNNTNPNMSIKQ